MSSHYTANHSKWQHKQKLARVSSASIATFHGLYKELRQLRCGHVICWLQKTNAADNFNHATTVLGNRHIRCLLGSYMLLKQTAVRCKLVTIISCKNMWSWCHSCCSCCRVVANCLQTALINTRWGHNPWSAVVWQLIWQSPHLKVKVKSKKLIYIAPSSPKIQRHLTAGLVGWAARGSMVK